MIGNLNLEVSRRGKSVSRKSRNMNIFLGYKPELVDTSAEDLKGFTFCMAPLNIPGLCNTNTEQPKTNKSTSSSNLIMKKAASVGDLLLAQHKQHFV